MTVVTPTDRPKSVCNRCTCIIDDFGGVFFVLSRCLLDFFSVGEGAFYDRTESDLFLFLVTHACSVLFKEIIGSILEQTFETLVLRISNTKRSCLLRYGYIILKSEYSICSTWTLNPYE